MGKNKMAEFEKSMTELEDILQMMSNQDTPLQKSVELYARAAELIMACNQGLEEARVKIQEIDDKMQLVLPEDEDGV